MRMRKKPNLVPRMERCAATLITDPEALRGRWLEQFPGYQALQLELGCGKGRFTADTAAQNPDIFLAAIEKVPDAMVVGMERVTSRSSQPSCSNCSSEKANSGSLSVLNQISPPSGSTFAYSARKPA